jgi:hypothetical protein
VIRGYAEQPSPRPGDALTLRVATDAPRFRVELYRCGARMACAGTTSWLPGRDAPAHLPFQDAGRAGPVAVPELLGQALDPAVAVAPVERADLEQPRVRAGRQVDRLGELADPAALGVDHQPGRGLVRRGEERAVEVGEVVRDQHHLDVRREVEGPPQLLPVRLQPVDLGVRRVALDDEVDRPAQQRHPGQVALGQVAEPAPVVLAPGDPLLLQADHLGRPTGDGDRPVLGPVDPDDDRSLGHAHLRAFAHRGGVPARCAATPGQ